MSQAANSYIGAAEVSFGARGSTVVQLMMALLTLGAITTYVIIIGEMGCQAVVQLTLHPPGRLLIRRTAPPDAGCCSIVRRACDASVVR